MRFICENACLSTYRQEWRSEYPGAELLCLAVGLCVCLSTYGAILLSGHCNYDHVDIYTPSLCVWK